MARDLKLDSDVLHQGEFQHHGQSQSLHCGRLLN